MTRNRIIVLNSWSALEETVRYLHTYEESEKVKIIHQQMQVSGVSRGNRKLYTPKVLIIVHSLIMQFQDHCIRDEKTTSYPRCQHLPELRHHPPKVLLNF